MSQKHPKYYQLAEKGMIGASNYRRPSVLERAIQIAEEIYARRNRNTANVMVAFMRSVCRDHQRRHLKLFKDEGGLYVRIGKRGQVKKYLKDMAGARIVDAGLSLAVFYEQAEGR